MSKRSVWISDTPAEVVAVSDQIDAAFFSQLDQWIEAYKDAAAQLIDIPLIAISEPIFDSLREDPSNDTYHRVAMTLAAAIKRLAEPQPNGILDHGNQ